VVSQSIGLILKVNRMNSSQALADEAATRRIRRSEVPRNRTHKRKRIRLPLIQKEQQFHVDSGGHAVVLSEEISDNCLRMLAHAIHDLIEIDGDPETEDRAVAVLRKLIEVALNG
jgi:hypothetical protein